MPPALDPMHEFITSVRGAWAGVSVPFVVLFIAMLVDIATGFSSAWLTKTVNSGASYKGLIRKAMMLLCVIFMAVLDPFTPGIDVAKITCWAFIIGIEFVSITENMAELGAPIPPVVIDVLSKLHPEKVQPISVRIDTSEQSGGPVDVHPVRNPGTEVVTKP